MEQESGCMTVWPKCNSNNLQKKNIMVTMNESWLNTLFKRVSEKVEMRRKDTCHWQYKNKMKVK